WRALPADGRYRDALAAAESLGFATLCTSLPDDQLLRLADVARFARRPARAIEALDAVRTRFADSDAAATAAFERGRIALAQKAPDEAAKWLALYLRERPDGALVREATGRLIEALQGARQLDEARDVARDYLARYPNGPHADLATRVIAGPR
ncbi:MAG TPA: tetratricopeptide repeat protein, partial [Nannocystaceae bacterium]|nr:tetratricopeptide repeat protein [Nannocystaceae bacterium]